MEPSQSERAGMENHELKAGMEVSVEHGGKWQDAKVIGSTKLITGRVEKITGWKLHVGPSALDMTFTADKIFPKGWRPPEKSR